MDLILFIGFRNNLFQSFGYEILSEIVHKWLFILFITSIHLSEVTSFLNEIRWIDESSFNQPDSLDCRLYSSRDVTKFLKRAGSISACELSMRVAVSGGIHPV